MVTEFPWEVLFHSLWLSDHGICKFLCEDYILIQSSAWTHIHTHVPTHTVRGTHSQSYPYSHIDTHTDSYYHTITLISHASKVILKIPQARLQQYVNCKLPDVQAGFRKGRGPEIKLQTSVESLKKQESFRKASTSALLTMPEPLTVWTTTTVESYSRDGKIRPPDLPPEKSECKSGSNS